MAGQFILGIDAGTSLIKTVVFDLQGQELGASSRKAELESPHSGWFQQDMRTVWEATTTTIKEAVQNSGINPADIAVIGPTGQGDGAWMVDQHGEPVAPAPLWNDGRAGEIVARWEADGVLSAVFKRGGTVLWPGAQAAILAWMRENEPRIFERISTVFCCKDWIKLKLTGTLSTDETDGSIPFMAMASRAYDDEQMRLLGLADICDKLPPVRQSHQIVGTVTAEAANLTGLKEGTPVVSGMIDVAASAVGIGVIDAGQSFSIIGTTALNAIVLDKPILEPDNVGATICHSVPGRWMRVLGSMAGTPNLDWYIANMGEIFKTEADQTGSDVFGLLEEAILQVPVGSGGLIFHPYLQGERAPFLNPNARAGMYGISADTTRAHLARSVYEGVALSIRDCFENIGSGVTTVMLSGGGANSAAWCQILADATNCTMSVPAGTQFGTLGAALAGAVGVGLFDSYASAAQQAVRIARTYQPDPHNVQRYNELYSLYRDLIERMGPFWAARHKFVEGNA